MKTFIPFIGLALSATLGGAQQPLLKPTIERAAYSRWNSTIGREVAVSPDGTYLAYGYSRDDGRADMFVVESTDGRTKWEFPGGFAGFQRATFSADNKRVALHSSDSVVVRELATQRKWLAPHGVMSRSGRWMAALWDTALVLTDLHTNRVWRYSLHSGDKIAVFAESEAALIASVADSVVRIDLATGKARMLYRGSRASEVSVDSSGSRVAFITGDSTGMMVRVYRPGMDSARILVTDRSPGMRPNTTVAADAPWFTVDGTQLYFKVAERRPVVPPDSSVLTKNVDIWHYKDQLLQSQQLLELPRRSLARYTTTVAVDGGAVIPLESRDTVLSGASGTRYVLMKEVANMGEERWSATNPEGQAVALVSLRDGERIPLPFRGFLGLTLSPSEHFVIGFDPKRQQYQSYEVATGRIRTITMAVPVPLGHEYRGPLIYGIAGWVVGDRAVLMNDRYDIWQVDPRGIILPINLTAGYGRRHEIVFRIETAVTASSRLKTNDVVVLRAFNQSTKDAGYWTMRVGRSSSPVLGSMEPYLFGGSILGGYFSILPVKAANAPVMLVVREAERDAPNWHVTTDLKSYRRLTNLQPQAEYNWLTAELHGWTKLDGTRAQGILYKPENFDATKKYPVILEYYEQRSDELHLYRKPAYSSGRLNIPWYVSHGYIVFVPDITYAIGHTTRGIVSAVVSAADYLTTFPWVDSTKIGIQGHSFGGYETLVLVTHSHRFAAANAAAAVSNWITAYGAPAFGERDNTWFVERGQGRMGTTPWENPELYVENSPLFRADSVTTPLLLMHNKGDAGVVFAQALEMFIALRRLQKPVWLLQYDGEGHTVDGAASRDYTIRQEQFFDHYLKGAPAPVWMTRGVPAAAKGVSSGLEYDLVKRTP